MKYLNDWKFVMDGIKDGILFVVVMLVILWPGDAVMAGTACRETGQYVVEEADRCCEGLKADNGSNAFVEGKCVDRSNTIAVALYGRTRCLACGDGQCDQFEDRCNCPEDCQPNPTRPKIHFQRDNTSPTDHYRPREFPLQMPEGQSAVYRKYLKKAWDTGDATICEHLPKRDKEYYPPGLSSNPVPTRGYPSRQNEWDQESAPLEDWQDFCRALAKRDAAQCPAERRSALPALHDLCRGHINSYAQKRNTGPGFCIDEIGKSLFYGDVRSCLSGWKIRVFGGARLPLDELVATSESIAPFTEREIDLLRCVEINDPKPRARCLTDFASRWDDIRVCDLIEDGPVGDRRRSECRHAVNVK